MNTLRSLLRGVLPGCPGHVRDRPREPRHTGGVHRGTQPRAGPPAVPIASRNPAAACRSAGWARNSRSSLRSAPTLCCPCWNPAQCRSTPVKLLQPNRIGSRPGWSRTHHGPWCWFESRILRHSQPGSLSDLTSAPPVGPPAQFPFLLPILLPAATRSPPAGPGTWNMVENSGSSRMNISHRHRAALPNCSCSP